MIAGRQYVKKDAPSELTETIRQIEERADSCFRPLTLLRLHANVGLWALLVGAINLVEKEIATRGDNTPHLDATLLNISRFVPVAMKWSIENGRRPSKLARRRWTQSIAERVNEALQTAHQYSGFLTCMPAWHKNRYAAEMISPTVVRFTVPGGARHREVSAFQKGFRPREGTYKGERPKKPDQTPKVKELFQRVFELCERAGRYGFDYDAPWDLWLELLPEYRARVAAIVRRAESLSLGDYTLGEFKEFYAALLVVCAAHEFLCFAWQKNYLLYPFDSAVLVRSRLDWTRTLSRLSQVASEKCQAIIGDLTFTFPRSIDLHIHPFVPLDSTTTNLALAPQFPLNSRPDENILRVCSNLRPDVFDVTSLEKESETLNLARSVCGQYSPQGPISLPKPNPDIDLLLADEASSTVVIAELKWVRKPTRPVEQTDRDEEVMKGIRQLEQIRRFLTENPDYLSGRRTLQRRLGEYENIYYMLLARDHWLWVEPTNDRAIVEFEAFSAAINRFVSLQSAITDLLRYEWLPVEGRDFTVRYDTSIANGVAIESETFYPA
jgi:hypothetical protein